MKLARISFKRAAQVDSRVERGKPEFRGRKKTVITEFEEIPETTSYYYQYLKFMERTTNFKFKNYTQQEIKNRLEKSKPLIKK